MYISPSIAIVDTRLVCVIYEKDFFVTLTFSHSLTLHEKSRRVSLTVIAVNFKGSHIVNCKYFHQFSESLTTCE